MHRSPQAPHHSRPLAPTGGQDPPVELAPYGARSPVSQPLADAHIYRPGAPLALCVLLLPVVLTLGLAAAALQVGHGVPIWLPVLALLWLPAAPLVWLATQSARTSAVGVAVGRPWRAWIELRWSQIEHVDERGMTLRINGGPASRETLVLAPRLLHDGARLRREILLRLPPKVLSVRLSHEAATLLHAGDISISAAGSLEGMVEARTRSRALLVPLALALVLLAGAAAALVVAPAAVPQPALLAAAAIGGLLALVCIAVAAWLPQRLTLDAGGMTIAPLLVPGRRRTLAWRDMDMLEYTPRLSLLRLRGKGARVLCAGPRLYGFEQSAIIWSYLQSRCREHNVLPIMRPRLP